MFPFFGGKIPHPEKTKKGILSSPFLKLKYAFLCGLPRGWRQNRLKSWGYQQRAGSVPNRRVRVGTGRGSPKHLPRFPQKNRSRSRGLCSQRHCWTWPIFRHQSPPLLQKSTESGEQYCNVPGWREAGWERVLPISNFRGRKRQLQERVHEALAANSCGNDASFKHIIIFKRRAEICS